MLSEAAPNHRRWIIIGVVAAVLVAGLAAVLVLSSDSTSGHHKPGPPLPVPAAIGTYTQRTDAARDQYRAVLDQSAKSATGELKRFLTTGQYAIYGSSAANRVPDLVMVMGRSADFPKLADSTTTNQAFGDFGSPDFLDAGHFGGTLECSAGTPSEPGLSVCVWTDSTSTGVILGLTSISADQLGSLTNTARDTIDG